jgi:hypothetical protein
MRSRFTLAFVPVLAVLALALVPAGSGAATAAKTTKVKCTANLQNQQKAGTPKGYDLGFSNCGKPLGKGITAVWYNETISSTIAAKGKTQSWGDNGAITTTYSASGPLSTSGPITITGTAKITGGTGKYKGAKGTGKISCTTPDLGQTLTCTETLTFSKL